MRKTDIIGHATRRGPMAIRKTMGAARELAQGMAELLWPTRCLGCDAPGVLLCDRCRSQMPRIDQKTACPHCGAPFGALVCTECTDCLTRDESDWVELTKGRDSSSQTPAPAPGVLPEFGCFGAVCCYGVLEWPLDSVIRSYKDAGEERVAGMLGAMIAAAVVESPFVDLATLDVVSFVPSTPKAFARRGRDHMLPVAQRAAELLGLPLADVLARADAADQRGLTRALRRRNARGGCVSTRSLAGARILLLDDVLTTGSTLSDAANACLDAGASLVDGACVARAW